VVLSQRWVECNANWLPFRIADPLQVPRLTLGGASTGAACHCSVLFSPVLPNHAHVVLAEGASYRFAEATAGKGAVPLT